MGLSPVYQHYANTTDDVGSCASIYQHRVFTTDQIEVFSSIFQHRHLQGSADAFAAIYQHLAQVAALGRIRGAQLESPLPIRRAVDFADSSETNTPAGIVRLFAQDKTLRFVNEDGLNVNLGLLGVPVGGIISWWPPPEFNEFGNTIDAPLPEGFEFCDGTAVQTANSPMFGFFKPALMRTDDAAGATQRFIKGADLTAVGVYGAGTTALVVGGSPTHIHTGTALSGGLHSHEPGDHRHVILTQNSSVVNSSGAIITGEAGGNFLISDADGPDVTDTEVLHRHTTVVPAHDHGGFTGPDPTIMNTSSVGETESSGTHTHTLQISGDNHEPDYVELAFIIRVI